MRPYTAKLSRATAAVAAILLSACTPAVASGPATPAPSAARPGEVAGSRAAFAAEIDSVVRSPEFRNAHWGILIIDPERGDTLYSHNAGKLFMPASNQKIITGAVALARLGPDYRYRTVFAAGGPVRNGVLDGDLLVYGSGDPSLSDRMRGDAMIPLREVADALHARGIRRIDGFIRSERDAFTDERYGYGWSYDDFPFPYSAPVDELFFSEGFARITVYGDSAGAPPRVVVRPSSRMLHVGNVAETVAARDTADRIVVRASDMDDGWDEDARVTGRIAVGDSVVRDVAIPNPENAFIQALAQAITERGIAWGGTPRPREARLPLPAPDTLHVMQSPPLRDILKALEKPSQNQIAEILLKTLGLELGGAGTAAAGRRIVEQQLVEWGADTSGFAVRDGSGLSRHNYVTPETIVRVLDAMRKRADFRVFYDALPIAGVDGTIGSRMRNTPAMGNLHAKTGTIDKARALSGYVTTADGRMLIFSTIANNHSVPNRYVERAQDLIGARLAGAKVGEW